jgi:hypothetical protein
MRPNGFTDRHYTSGQAVALTWHDPAGDHLADTLGLILAQQMFTPNGITNPNPPLDDRPYAGYLYLGGFWQREHDNTFDHLELDLGVVGPSSGAEFNQEWVHDLFDDDDPDWSTQLGDELAVNLSWRRKWRIDFEPFDNPQNLADDWAWQFIPEAGIDVGTVYRRAHVGGLLRYGFNLPDDFGPGRLIDPSSATGRSIRKGVGTYFYVKAVGRYVEWNTFIEGSNRRNPSRAVSLEPFLGEFTAGFSVDWRTRNNWVFSVDYGQTYFTHEFEEQKTDDGLGHIAIRVRHEF